MNAWSFILLQSGLLEGVAKRASAEFSDGGPFKAKTGTKYASNFQIYLRNDLDIDLTQRYMP